MNAWKIGDVVIAENNFFIVTNHLKTRNNARIVKETYFLKDRKNGRQYKYILGEKKLHRIY